MIVRQCYFVYFNISQYSKAIKDEELIDSLIGGFILLPSVKSEAL